MSHEKLTASVCVRSGGGRALFAAGTAQAVIIGPETLTNPSFESGTTASWTVSGGNGVVTMPYFIPGGSGFGSKDYCFQGDYNTLSQGVTLSAGDYLLGTWIASRSGSDGNGIYGLATGQVTFQLLNSSNVEVTPNIRLPGLRQSGGNLC